MSVQTATRTELPRVNLIPPEIQENRDFKRLQVGLSVLVVLAIGAVGALYWQGRASVTEAKTSLAAAQAKQRVLQNKINKLRDVTRTQEELQAAQATLAQVRSTNVYWSKTFADLSTTLPTNLWYTSLKIQENLKPGAYPTAAAAPAEVGSITFDGMGEVQRSSNQSGWPVQEAVADWLDSMSKIAYFANATFTKADEDTIGDRPVVKFNSTVTVTSSALCDKPEVCS